MRYDGRRARGGCPRRYLGARHEHQRWKYLFVVGLYQRVVVVCGFQGIYRVRMNRCRQQVKIQTAILVAQSTSTYPPNPTKDPGGLDRGEGRWNYYNYGNVGVGRPQLR